MVYEPGDLEPLEVALLGVLCIGLPPSRASDDTFRVDHVTAVVAGLQQRDRGDVHLLPDGVSIEPEFRLALRGSIQSLAAKSILTSPAPDMPAAPGGYDPGLQVDVVNPDEHPILIDSYLGQACMEVLFKIPAVYPYLMDRYSKSGEVWRRLREAGYAT